ncbi:hypothetical protein [Halomontanus rarus]|uniref:hypothetical protein n=1 Tax=Halomontanus rarus TaxID=3034020 RepID=UPI00307C16B2
MTNETFHRVTRIALAFVMVFSVVATAGVGLGTVTAQEDTQGADIVVEQPTYVEDDIEEQSEGGRPVYIAQGHVQRIYPQGFDTDDVRDYGLATGSGELSYESDTDRYTLDPEGETGSFELYWVVDEEYEVQDGNETTTETETVRYEAVVRVDDLSSVTVMSPDEANDLRSDADEWRDWNETVTEVKNSGILGHMISSPTSNTEVMQGMVNAYLTTRSPTHLLDGGFTAGVIIIGTTLGGIFLFMLFKVPDALAVRKLWGELHERKSVEADEGELAERQERVDLEERLQRFANWDWQDIPSVTDHEAAEFRNGAAETPLEGLLTVMWSFLPETMKEDRVRAMGLCGYVAQVDRLEYSDDDVATDGGVAAIDSATLVHTDDVLAPDETVRDRDDLEPLDDPSETLLDAIALDDPELVEFPLENADFDASELEQPLGTMSLPEIIEKFDFSEWSFEDDERIGEIMVEFMTSIYNHPITNDDGHIDPVRLQLEQLLQFMQAADDRFQIPLAKWYKQHFERALQDYDRDDELRTFLDNHRSRTDA